MNTLLVVARALHYASAIVLFGELVFALAVASSRRRHGARGEVADTSRIFRVMAWAILAGLASGAAWFALEAAAMSGMSLLAVVNRDTLGVVLHDTAFGRVWTVRAGLLVALCVVGIAIQRSRSVDRVAALCTLAALVAGAYLGALAWAGHAAAGQGVEDAVQKVADVAHLVAAGAWLGALPALVDALGARRSDDVAARAARRFSTLGLASVTALIASGLVNAWYQVGTLPGLFGTLYGRLLLVKLALFAAMIAVAVINRGILTPRVVAAEYDARRTLRRNALAEMVLGLGVVVVVARLGVTVPAAHEMPLWPFRYTFSTLPMEQSPWVQLVVAAAGFVAFIAGVFLMKGILGRPPRVSLGTLAAILIPAGLFASLLVVPAHPTTYASSPVGYTTKALAAGALVYASNCSSCHGEDGRGTRSAAGSPPASAGDLSEQIRERSEGDLFWSIAHGIPGTAMPGFAPRLTDIEIWNVIQFLDAQSASRNAVAMSERLKPLLPIPAPDFAYERIGRSQESLSGARDDRVTLLVLYTLPESAPRLVDIATNLANYGKAGARIIAAPVDGAPAADALDSVPGGESLLATAGPDVAVAYALFAPQLRRTGEPVPAHAEYLIDRQGQLRARWIGVPSSASDRKAESISQIDVLVREPPRPLPQWGHRH